MFSSLFKFYINHIKLIDVESYPIISYPCLSIYLSIFLYHILLFPLLKFGVTFNQPGLNDIKKMGYFSYNFAQKLKQKCLLNVNFFLKMVKIYHKIFVNQFPLLSSFAFGIWYTLRIGKTSKSLEKLID